MNNFKTIGAALALGWATVMALPATAANEPVGARLNRDRPEPDVAKALREAIAKRKAATGTQATKTAAPAPESSTSTTVATVTWRMGEQESLAASREMALQKARLVASEKAGSIVQTVSTLDGAQLKETVKVITLGAMRLLRVEERLGVDAAGGPILTLTAEFEFDHQEVKRRAELLATDVDRAKRLQDVIRRNQELELALAQKQSPRDERTLPPSALRSDAVLTQISSVRQRARGVFVRSDLEEMAAASTAIAEEAAGQVQSEVLDVIFNGTYSADLVGAERRGADLFAMVRIKADYDHKRVSAQLTTWHGASPMEKQAPVNGGFATLLSQRHVLTGKFEPLRADAMWNQLEKSSIWLVATLGTERLSVPIVRSFRGSSWGDVGYCDWYYYDRKEKPTEVCILRPSPRDSGTVKLLGVKDQTNPAAIRATGLPKDAPLAIQLELVMQLPDGSVRRRVIQ